jgi:hypothetical protein
MIPKTEERYRADHGWDLRDTACNEPGSLSSAKRMYKPMDVRRAKLRKSTATTANRHKKPQYHRGKPYVAGARHGKQKSGGGKAPSQEGEAKALGRRG